MITEDSLAACFMTLAALGYRLLMLNRTVYIIALAFALLFAAFIHVASELMFILNSARLLPARV